MTYVAYFDHPDSLNHRPDPVETKDLHSALDSALNVAKVTFTHEPAVSGLLCRNLTSALGVLQLRRVLEQQLKDTKERLTLDILIASTPKKING